MKSAERLFDTLFFSVFCLKHKRKDSGVSMQSGTHAKI